MNNILKNSKLHELSIKLQYLDYLENMMCGRELPFEGQLFFKRERLRLNNQINYELSITKIDS
jgi:hypothetical protein